MERLSGTAIVILAGALGLAPLACGSSGQGAKTPGTGGAPTASGGSGRGGATLIQGSGGAATGGLSTGGAASGGRGVATGGTTFGKSDASAGGQGLGGLASGGSVIGGGAGGASSAKGGATGNDAAIGTGGVSGTGGAAVLDAATNSGGAIATGGVKGTGGTPGTGGATGTGGTVTGSCTEPPAAGPLLGWASQSGAGYGGTSVATTTGGGSATPVTVTTLSALNSAAAGSTPAVIYVKGVLAAGTVKIGSNKTVAGICGAELHGHVDMGVSVNVILRNIKIVGYNCSDSISECKSGADAITVNNAGHHLWFDHLDVSDGSDGNLDITNGSDFVTVSWTKFSYSTNRTDPVTGSTGHRFSNLIGAADGLAEDVGHLNITWHHDWWADNIAERMPRSRDGKIHVVNSLFTAIGNDYCTNSGSQSSLLVENNVYVGVNNPLQEDSNGNMLARGNVFTSTSGSKTASGTGFTPPYTLTPDAMAGLEATLRAQAGPQ